MPSVWENIEGSLFFWKKKNIRRVAYYSWPGDLKRRMVSGSSGRAVCFSTIRRIIHDFARRPSLMTMWGSWKQWAWGGSFQQLAKNHQKRSKEENISLKKSSQSSGWNKRVVTRGGGYGFRVKGWCVLDDAVECVVSIDTFG